jgi:hypothetical protein
VAIPGSPGKPQNPPENMTTRLHTYHKTTYLDQSIDDAPVQGWWFTTVLVYGPFGRERMVNKVLGRMPPLKADFKDNLLPLTEPRKPVQTKEEALEGVRPVEWERLKKSLESKRDET